MPRKSFWATLILAMLLAGFASLRMAPTASASPARVIMPQHSTTNSAHLQWVSSCQNGFHLEVGLSVNGPLSVFNNYSPACVNYDGCAGTNGTASSSHIICLYQDANYQGQEIEFWGHGCANLTDFAGPGPGGTWNDTMSSFRIYAGPDTTGALWWNTGNTGYYYLYGPAGSGRTSATTYIGSTWNDQASSIEIDNLLGSADTGCNLG